MFIYVFGYAVLVTLSMIIMFYLMIERIKMMYRYTDHYDYLRNDCMISNITETKIGQNLGVFYTVTIIPIIFFLIFHVMDVLRIRTYYKNYVIDKDKLSSIDFNIVRDINHNESIWILNMLNKNIIKPIDNLIDIDKLHDNKSNIIKISI